MKHEAVSPLPRSITLMEEIANKLYMSVSTTKGTRHPGHDQYGRPRTPMRSPKSPPAPAPERLTEVTSGSALSSCGGAAPPR